MKRTLIIALVILTMLSGTCYAGFYDVVNLNGTTIVDDTYVLKEKTVISGVDSYDCPIDTPVNVVAGMTYTEYIDYVNEYYGHKEGDDGYIAGSGVVVGTEKINSGSFAYDNTFAIGGNMGAEGSRRQLNYIAPKYAFYTRLYRLYGSIALAQLGNGNGGWFTGGLYFGTDTNNATQAQAYNTKAATDSLPPVPWFTAVMNKKGTVYVNSYSQLPHLVGKGYTLISSGTEVYTGIDTNNNNSSVKGPTYVYCKVFEKGDTVEIFNPANGNTTGHPPAWFFTTGVPDTYTYEYGKKSSGVVATSFNSTVTDGVLYKDLFADVEDSANTSGGRWVSDFQPLGTGQRIASVEDESLLGCEYFTFSINNRSKFGTLGGNLLEFKVDKPCDVVILTKSADSAAVFEGYTKAENVPGLTGVYPAANVVDTLYKMGMPYADMSIDMINDLYKSSGLTFKQIYNKWLSSYFPGATEEELLAAVNTASNNTSLKMSIFESVDSVSSVTGSDTKHAYTVTHTKSYSAGDTAVIPDPTGKAGFDRPIVVVVRPRYTSEAPDLPSTFTTLDAKVGSNSHFKPVHQYGSMQNPPDFTWPQINNAYSYDVVVCADEDLNNVVYSKNEIKYAYYNFPYAFRPGTYWWAVRYRTTDGGKPSEWSVARRFRIDPSAHEYLVPEDFGTVVSAVPQTHPRIWFTQDTIDDFVSLKNTPEGYTVYQKMVNLTESYMKREIIAEEPEYGASNATSASTIMGFAAQNAALCYILTDDAEDKKKYGDFAVDILMEMSTWDMENGGSAFNSNDQSYFEFTMRASMAYDWMYNHMTEEERATIQQMLVDRFDYLNNLSGGVGHIGKLRIEPFNSHLWSYIGYYGIACMALVHDVDGVDGYFKEMLELNSAHLPPMSIEDGGWSKGTAYWTYAFSRDKWFMDTMKYGGYIDYYDKAWARNELNWVLYMYPDNSYGSFGDEAGKTKPGQYHIMGLSKLGKFTDNPVAYWLRNRIGNISLQTGSGAFDSIIYADTAAEEGEAPYDYPNSHVFIDQGMVAMHSSIVESNRTSLYFRSGQYGSYNHMHADQNAFMIEHNGNRLASKSGFYDSYHSYHDSGFTRQTFAHNSVTYNGGFGQKDDSKDANGKIEQFVTHHRFDAAVGNAANAYVGNIDVFDRSIIYLRPDSYIVVDELQNDTAQTYEWWLNAPADTMTVSGKTAHVENSGSNLDVEIMYPAVNDGVFANDYINPSDGVEYYPDVTSSKVTEETAAAGFDRVHFQTPSALNTTIVATMNVNEGSERAFTKTEGTNYIKLTVEGDDTVVYVCTLQGSEVTTDNGYTFKGTALVMNGTTIMLVNGTSLSYGGSAIMEETTEPVTFVMGEGQLSIGSDDDVVVKINKTNEGIKKFLPDTLKVSASAFDISAITDTNLRAIEAYNGEPHGSMGIMLDYTDSDFTLYADKGQYMLLTEDNSIVNAQQLCPNGIIVEDLGDGVASLSWQESIDGAIYDVQINGEIFRNVTSPYEYNYGDAETVTASVRGRMYALTSSWTEEATMYPGHKLDISFVKFTDNGDGTVSAELKVGNDSSSGVLRCKAIVASYNEAGEVINTAHSKIYSIAKNKEKLFELTVDSTDAVSYKAFVWNSTGDIHMVKGATSNGDFVADSGADGTYVSSAKVALDNCNRTNGYLYTNLHGRTEDDYSTVNGGRIAYNYPANASQYHEIYYADESLEGYDYFAFQAGGYALSDYDSVLSFDITEDSEVVILSTTDLEFEGFDKETNSSGWLISRYMNKNFADALRTIGITPTYGMAADFDADRTDGDLSEFVEKHITPAYALASEEAKKSFDTKWAVVATPNSDGDIPTAISQSNYSRKYSEVYALADGAESLTVTIPKETTGNSGRNIIVVVKPYNRTANSADTSVCVPLTKAASSDAQPSLKAVEIDGEEVAISEFTNNEYSYELSGEEAILPVIKGITADNGLYSSTDYDIANDGLSAVATITVKNLFTDAEPVVYTVNITLDTSDGATVIKDHVSNFKILPEGAEKTFILGPGTGGTYSDRLTHDYLTEDGPTPSDASPYSINQQRTFGVTNEILGLENCFYLRMPSQSAIDNYLKTSDLWSGGDGAEDVAWMQFKVNKDCDVVIVPGTGVPNFVTPDENGWFKTNLSDYAFTLSRHASDNTYTDYTSRSKKVMYVRSFNAGDTVTLYNANNGLLHSSYDVPPYFAFVRVK